jgi:hypothetical protein
VAGDGFAAGQAGDLPTEEVADREGTVGGVDSAGGLLGQCDEARGKATVDAFRSLRRWVAGGRRVPGFRFGV